MKQQLISALKSHAEGHIHKHLMNVEVLLQNPVGTAGSVDIMQSLEDELLEVAKYHDVLEMIEVYR